MPKRITYEYFCVLGGIASGKCMTRAIYNGSHFMYWAYYTI